MKYYVITNYDGDTYVKEWSKEKLLPELDDGAYSDCLTAIPIDADTNTWECRPLIIKGEIVTPIAKETVIKHELK